MPDTASAASLLLKLYELRTEPTLRAARAWFGFEFHPQSAKEVLATWLGPGHESAPYRMVTTHWDMAASLVVQGAIPVEMFNAANTEHFVTYAKLRPFLADVRAGAGNPDYLSSLEAVATSGANSDERLAMYQRYLDRQRTLASEGKQRSHLTA
jgi:hypothetical protein